MGAMGTTVGKVFDKFLSAIYFTGTNINTDRVLNITLNEKGHMYAMAERRKQYATYLHKHEHDSKMDTNDQLQILEWTIKREGSQRKRHIESQSSLLKLSKA